jgi:hypothetical protein
MKAFTLSALSALLAGSAVAAPLDLLSRDNSNNGKGGKGGDNNNKNKNNGNGFSDIDITILQFALTVRTLA